MSRSFGSAQRDTFFFLHGRLILNVLMLPVHGSFSYFSSSTFYQEQQPFEILVDRKISSFGVYLGDTNG